MSKIKVNEIEAATGSTVSIPTGQTFSVADGIPATNLSGTIADARLPTVPVSKGGTGLTSLGSAGQAVKVNTAGNALEFGTISTPIKAISTQTNSTRSSVGAGSTLFSGTYNQQNANGNIIININLITKGPQHDGAGSTVFTYDGTTYTGFISYHYTGQPWNATITGQFQINGSSSTGSKNWSLAKPSGRTYYDIVNPNNSDHSNYHTSSTSTITFMEI
jgi:hypothetical protein